MFRWMGEAVIAVWPAVLAVWLLLVLVLKFTAPEWQQVATDGELRHLPGDAPSRKGTELYQAAFPQDLADSSIVLIVYREDKPLTQVDEQFIVGDLVPGLKNIAATRGGVLREQHTLESLRNQALEELEQLGKNTQEAGAPRPGTPQLGSSRPKDQAERKSSEKQLGSRASAANDAARSTTTQSSAAEQTTTPATETKVDAAGSGTQSQSVPQSQDESDDNEEEDEEEDERADSKSPQVVSIASIGDFVVGPMLRSADGHATLVSFNLSSGFLKTQNKEVVEDVTQYVDQLRGGDELPADLQIAVSGSAMVGVDTIRAVTQSTRAVRNWATWIVVGLLLLVFRAPLAALLPLVTMYISVEIAIALLAWGAYFELIQVFDGLVLYVSVIVYGAGVDYSLFIISRHQEEYLEGQSTKQSALTAITSAGTAVAASAGTEIVGIGLLGFAEFGKFQQAGLGIALGLLILLLASLTLTPALLCLSGRWAFWPARFSATPQKQRGDTSLVTRIWRRIGEWQQATPGRIWLGTLLVLLPVAVFGVLNVNHQTYDLTSSLPDDSTSVHGMATLSEHFSRGSTGPITLMLQDPATDFGSPAGLQKIAKLTDKLQQQSEELHIASIRSLADPLGTSERAEQVIELLGSIVPGLSFLKQGELVVADDAGLSELEKIVQQLIREQAYQRYVSQQAPYTNHVTWLTITPSADPYASESIQQLDKLEQALEKDLDLESEDAAFYLIGATASLRDVRDVARRDFIRIAIMIPLGVLLVLMVLLRKIVIPIYLILTVLLTFFVTIGASTALFWWLNGSDFTGLQWTVPVLLFVLLVAVGEDYSVLLVTRTDEEQEEHGPVKGITEALVSTGGLISGAGLIMAGTFSALAIGGTLDGMHQLGFALAFGMLLDTFVVRPLLVPSFQYLLLRWSSRQAGRSATSTTPVQSTAMQSQPDA